MSLANNSTAVAHALSGVSIASSVLSFIVTALPVLQFVSCVIGIIAGTLALIRYIKES